MKLVLKALFGVVALMFVFLLLPDSTSAQKNKTPLRRELAADFRDWPGDKIHSNNTDPFYSNQNTPSYPNDVFLQSGGTLYMRIQKNQRVFFDFNDPVRSWDKGDGMVNCQEWSPDGTGAGFTYAPPAFLLGDGRPNNDFTVIATGGSYTQDTAGAWHHNSTYFDFTALNPVGAVAYVAMNVRFDIVEQDEQFGIMFGSRIWKANDYAAPISGWTGIVQVIRTSDASWYVEPIPSDHPIAAARELQANQAALYLVGQGVKRGHGSGNCDLGDWWMPFAMTLTLR